MLTDIQDKNYWRLNVQETAELLETDEKNGLSAQEAKDRLAAFGRNTLKTAKKEDRLKIFLS